MCRGEKTTPKGRFQNDLIMNFYISVHYSNEKQISSPSHRVLGSTSRNLSIINRTSDWLLKTETITSLCPCVTRYKLNLFCPPSLLTLQFINCLEFNFCRRYLQPDSHTNTVISTHFAYSSIWHRKP